MSSVGVKSVSGMEVVDSVSGVLVIEALQKEGECGSAQTQYQQDKAALLVAENLEHQVKLEDQVVQERQSASTDTSTPTPSLQRGQSPQRYSASPQRYTSPPLPSAVPIRQFMTSPLAQEVTSPSSHFSTPPQFTSPTPSLSSPPPSTTASVYSTPGQVFSPQQILSSLKFPKPSRDQPGQPQQQQTQQQQQQTEAQTQQTQQPNINTQQLSARLQQLQSQHGYQAAHSQSQSTFQTYQQTQTTVESKVQNSQSSSQVPPQPVSGVSAAARDTPVEIQDPQLLTEEQKRRQLQQLILEKLRLEELMMIAKRRESTPTRQSTPWPSVPYQS
ncbi:hypothetical protein Pmani_035141 [Petrolisthes manimaculis]|uniref:Uncharacterized protein n=1 Tax=Petrolisthes manimaculis TaxID=1843537 RepID=A0AAE1NL73_9EUCA|nr:hypothetical protein Pmani_035141 [Petrolisthes manimaculis]